MKTSLKLFVGPMILVTAIAIMYAVSIDLNAINRADVAFSLMGILASFHVWVAYRWFQKGFMTFELMKTQEKVATSIIEKLIKKYEPNNFKGVVDELLADELGAAVSDLTKIIDKHKS